MPAQLPDIDFARIRHYGDPASRSGAFEELSSILIEQGVVDWPDGVRFFRFGNPDGGREGKGVLPSGEVWAWQAKYLFEFDASAVAQATSSLRRTLDLEPALTRYFIALPIDLPAGDTETRTSAQTRWDDKEAEWKALADAKGLSVEFEFVGAHRLLTALTEARHAGRARYWFGTELLAQEWQARRLEEVIAKAGRRYTRRLHVEVETARTLDGLDRDERFVRRWQERLASLRRSKEWPWRAPSGLEGVFDEALAHAGSALDQADAALLAMVAAVSGTDEVPVIDDALNAALAAVIRVDDLLHEHSLTNGRYFVGEAASLYSQVSDAASALRRAERLARSVTTAACRERMLVLTGRAGVGKTHLLCDLASRRVELGRPTILLLGQDFDTRPLLTQLGSLAHMDGTVEDVLGVLDAAAEASGSVGVLAVDAINEGERPERWGDDLRALRAAARRYQRIAVVVSCRTEFVRDVVGDDAYPRVAHEGFGEATDVAVRRFTQEFGLEPPTFPVLTPEFNNPLFLKLTCESLATLGASRFPFGAAGLITVCDAFLEAVNKRLAEPGRCDYDKHEDLVRRVVRELAAIDGRFFERADVKRITEVALPDRSWSRSLMQGLISEGVLITLTNDRIAFGYQRLGDASRASVLAELTWDDLAAWWRERNAELWRERGVLGALAVILPEVHGREVLDLAIDDGGRVPYDVIEAFLESLLLRAPAAVSERASDVVRRLLGDGYRPRDIWDRLVRIACVPAHPLNARWLHSWLSDLTVAERDQNWSAWLIGAVGEDGDGPVERLLEWAWPQDLSSREPIPDEVSELATLALGWFQSTSDRRVRDQATKALVSVAERGVNGFAAGLQQFARCNDPYVVERMAAAACGLALRSGGSSAVMSVADAAHELVVDGWPEHLLTRDYIRRVFSAAREVGWSGPTGAPPYGSTWPVDTPSLEDIEAMAGPPEYEYGSIWHSLTGMGDFGRYILRSALDDIVADDQRDLVHTFERAVFDRVLELGWTPERFRAIDYGRSGRSDGPVERVGKKYQWIGFYESLGRVADTHEVKSRWSDDPPGPYRYAEQLIWRDLDPTVLARKPSAPPPGSLWFSPATAGFPSDVTSDYPSDLAGVPEPLDLIAVSDHEARRWLVLTTSPSWDQPLSPEVAALRVPQLATWMQVHAYLVPVREVPALREWAVGKDWYGRWMPDHVEPHNLLLGGHPDDPEWAAAGGTVDWREARSGGPQPAQFVETAAWYGGTGTSRDASAAGETRGFVPTRALFDILRLRRGVDFSWSDNAGVAIADPSVVSGGPASLVMRRDLVGLVGEAGYTLFWTVLTSRELHHHDFSHPGDEYRWVSASASYVLEGGRIEKVGSLAGDFRPGPHLEHSLDWDILVREHPLDE